jgi:hypothetical protein
MTKDEALKMAIEALQTIHDENFSYLTINKLGGENNQCMVFAREAIKACKKALEQPTVAELNDEYLRDTYVEGLNQPAQGIELEWYNKGWTDAMFDTEFPSKQDILKAIFDAVYSQYPKKEWQGLTDDEKKGMWLDTDNISWPAFKETYLLIEQALKDKNT